MAYIDEVVRRVTINERNIADLTIPELSPDLISPFLQLTGLRGFWPMSSFDENGDAFDLCGQGRTMGYNGNPTYNYDGVVPYIDLDGTGDYLDRADEAGLDIIGTETYVASAARGLTCGGWWHIDDTSPASTEYLLAKYGAALASRAYRIIHQVNDMVVFGIHDGATDVSTAAIGPTGGGWHFIAGRFIPSTEVKVWLGAATGTNVVGVHAALNNANSDLYIGARSDATLLFNGRAALVFLCAAALSDAIVDSVFQQTRAAFGV